MRVLAATVLLAGSLVGCVGDFSDEHIEASYHRCLDSFRPMSGVKVAQWDADCERVRAFDYDYRLSLRRLAPCNFLLDCASGGSAPTRTIVIPNGSR